MFKPAVSFYLNRKNTLQVLKLGLAGQILMLVSQFFYFRGPLSTQVMSTFVGWLYPICIPV